MQNHGTTQCKLSNKPPATGRISINNKSIHLLTQILFLSLITMIASETLAAPRLMVTPTRLVFDGNTRSAQVSVINTGDETGTYRIELVNRRMTFEGQFEDVKTAQPGELFADNMVRYSPRQVVLEPGKSQVVRFMLRKRAGLEPGEYRSHILFKAIPKDAGLDVKSLAKSDNISISLTPIISISIPVIVRHGKTDASVAFSTVKYNPPPKQGALPSLYMELQRGGNQSVYGDMLVEYVQNDGVSTVIAQINGIAIYTPNDKRALTLPLKVPDGIDLKSGLIRVFYREKAGQKNSLLAETELKLP
jgi:P pilus assembly chaperone PapD